MIYDDYDYYYDYIYIYIIYIVTHRDVWTRYIYNNLFQWWDEPASQIAELNMQRLELRTESIQGRPGFNEEMDDTKDTYHSNGSVPANSACTLETCRRTFRKLVHAQRREKFTSSHWRILFILVFQKSISCCYHMLQQYHWLGRPLWSPVRSIPWFRGAPKSHGFGFQTSTGYEGNNSVVQNQTRRAARTGGTAKSQFGYGPK